MNSAEDKLLSCLAVVVAGWMTLGVLGLHLTKPSSQPAPLAAKIETSVEAIAKAIARAEGYYAAGDYDGYSLPHKLNNPGSLKKPALGAESLPTWKDTGLIIFPTEEMGWAALQHQVELMLNGNSTIYTPKDTLLLVASKYADGDLNWGRQVAFGLGVPPSATLAEIGERSRTSSGVPASITPAPTTIPLAPATPASLTTTPASSATTPPSEVLPQK